MNEFINDLIQSKQKVTVLTIVATGTSNSVTALQYDGTILSRDDLGIVIDCGKGGKAGIPNTAIASIVPFFL